MEMMQVALADAARVLVSWANLPAIIMFAFLARLTRRMLTGQSWLAGDGDLIIAFAWAIVGGFIIERVTPGFSYEMWAKRGFMYMAGICTLYKPALVIAMIPDPILKWIPGPWGELARAVSTARAAAPNIADVTPADLAQQRKVDAGE